MTVNKLTYPAKENAVQEKINEIIDNLGASITVDQTYDGTSANPQSGVAIAGELSTNYQPKLVSGTNIKTINNTSLLGSGDIDPETQWHLLANLSASSGGLTIIGEPSTGMLAINIGAYSEANDGYSIAIGENAIADDVSAIQIGHGTNSTANSLSVGFFDASTNYTLLDGTTGLIPDARISSNIARTSAIPTQASDISAADTTLSNVSSIDSNSAVQTALDGKANTSLSNLSATGKTVIDGQVVNSLQTILSNGTSLNGSTNLTKRIDVPNDGHIYEVIIRGGVSTGSTSGNNVALNVYGNQDSYSRSICACRTRTASSVNAAGSCIVHVSYVTTNATNITIERSTSFNGSIDNLQTVSYRRVGTNS